MPAPFYVVKGMADTNYAHHAKPGTVYYSHVKRAAIVVLLFFLAASCGNPASGQAPPATPLAPEALRTWLTVIASDEFEGRSTFSAGIEKAAAYISDRLMEAGVRPGGDNGSYLQNVSVQSVQSTNQSTLTVEVNGESRVFQNGVDVFFTPDVGAKRTLVLDDVEFVGYGLHVGSVHSDYAGRDVRGKAVIWLGEAAPGSLDSTSAARFLESRASIALDEMGAAASITSSRFVRGRRNAGPSSFTTTQRLDLPRAPELAVSDEVLTFLFSASRVGYDEIRAKVGRREELTPASIKGVKLTFNLDADYRVLNTSTTQNVVGFIDGADSLLKNTYVAFGAHYDHLGLEPDSRSVSTDRINNGADDDGSGSAALIGLANAFISAKPRRSIMLVWHAGEERGLWGSKYLADHPPVPLENIVAQLNVDMIGRNRDNKNSEENTVYAVGADRISTELHNILIDANAGLGAPLNIDFEMNDAADPERIYFRSDHFSYAAKGIPVIFFFTGLHPDYHRVTDSVDKIHFDKMSRITRLIYELGLRLANLDHAPVRDFKGARTGRGFAGKLN
ncbi:MAG TPA: M28 family peptidase [Terriglobia bacterium]|nr:M28 family peptidase [Terriglobia bacterium]